MSSRPDKLYDRRIVARNISRNKLTRKDYEQYLKNLPDAKDKAVSLAFDEESEEPGKGDGGPVGAE